MAGVGSNYSYTIPTTVEYFANVYFSSTKQETAEWNHVNRHIKLAIKVVRLLDPTLLISNNK